MSNNKLYKVKVKESGKEIQVYKLKQKEIYIDFADCKTEYKREELIFI